MRLLKAFGLFWYDFVVGDDWKIAAYVLATLTVTAVLVARGAVGDTLVAVGCTLLLMAGFALGVSRDARRSRR